MKKILKYALSRGAKTSIEMPQGAKILCAQAQHNELYVWALVDHYAPLETRYFETHVTGYEIKDANELRYIGTAQFANGSFVLHAFERAVIDVSGAANDAKREHLKAVNED